jgi:hypothetical protein
MVKRLVSLVIALCILIACYVGTSADSIDIVYDRVTKCVKYDTTVTAAISGTRYRVLGFTVKLDGFSTTIKMGQGLDYDNGDGTKTVRFNIPVVGSGNSIMQRNSTKVGLNSFIRYIMWIRSNAPNAVVI